MLNRRLFIASSIAVTTGCAGGYEESCEQLGGTDQLDVGTPVTEVTDTSGRWPTPYGPFDGTRFVRESGRYTGPVKRAWRRTTEAFVGGDGSYLLADRGLVLTGGTLYAVAEVNYEETELVAIDPTDGRVVWRDDTINITGSVVAGPELLYLRDEGTLVAFDPDQQEVVWRVQFGMRRRVSVPVVDGKRVFVQVTGGDGGGRLYALRDGQREWNTPASAGPVVADGRLYTISDETVKAVAPDSGELLWTSALEESSLDKLAARGGRVYLTGSGVTAVDAASGDRLWSHSAPPGRTRRATVGHGRVYVPTRKVGVTWPRLYTYAPGGSEPLSCGQLSSFTLSGPVVATDEVAVYPGVVETGEDSNTGFLQAQRPDGTVEWRVTSSGGLGRVSMCAGCCSLFLFDNRKLRAFAFE
jgi:outer membrane protein assembly factor BamB